MSTARTGIRMTGWRAVAVWLVALSGVLSIIVSQVLNPSGLIVALIIGEVVASFGLVGAVVVTHLPDNLVGWLLWGSGAVLGWATAGIAYATHSAVSCGGCLPATVPIAVIANLSFGPVIGVVGVVMPLLFPDGRLASRRWLGVAWLGMVATVLFTASIAVTPGPMSGGVENPIGVGMPGQIGIIQIGSLVCLCVAVVLALASVVWRFRHTGVVERQQLRWFGYTGLLMIAALVFGIAAPLDEAWVLMFAGLGLMPLAIGVAILRYRLYDLDRLVSRTIAYAVVTGGLILVYLAINLALTTAFSSLASGNAAVVVASTLTVAALFAPLRRRVQGVVDRRFDRARYDARQTAAAFSERLRGQVDLPSLVTDLQSTVAGTLSAARVGVWLRTGGRP
jgi:hypothetical protein